MLKFVPVERGRTEGGQVINRAAAVLRSVAACGEAGASLRAVASETGLHRATTHRILSVLIDEGFIEYVKLNKAYRLGVEIVALGAAMGDRFDIKKLAEPSLNRLSDAFNDSVYLAVRSCYDGLCLDLRLGSYPSSLLRLHVNDRWPLGVGAFTIPLLAFLPDTEVAEIINRNAPRLVGLRDHSSDRLLRVVRETRERGYAVNFIKAYPGFCGVGVPVLDPKHRPVASLCVAGLTSRFDHDRQAAVAAGLWKESKQISRRWQEVRALGPRSEAWRMENESSRLAADQHTRSAPKRSA